MTALTDNAAMSTVVEPVRKLTWQRFFRSSFFLATVAILFIAAGAGWWIHSLGGLDAFRSRYGRIAPAIIVPVHMAVASLPIPADAICIANGALFGFWFGALLSWLGWYGAALAKFWLGRRARHDFDVEARMKRLPQRLQRFPVGHPVFLIGSRLIPGLGGNVSTYLPGAAGVPLGRHLWCSAIAIIPGAVLTAGVGAGFFGQ